MLLFAIYILHHSYSLCTTFITTLAVLVSGLVFLLLVLSTSFRAIMEYIEKAPFAGMTEILGAVVRAPLVGVAEQLNTRLWGVEPWRIVAGTASVSLGKHSDLNLDLEPLL